MASAFDSFPCNLLFDDSQGSGTTVTPSFGVTSYLCSLRPESNSFSGKAKGIRDRGLDRIFQTQLLIELFRLRHPTTRVQRCSAAGLLRCQPFQLQLRPVSDMPQPHRQPPHAGNDRNLFSFRILPDQPLIYLTFMRVMFDPNPVRLA